MGMIIFNSVSRGLRSWQVAIGKSRLGQSIQGRLFLRVVRRMGNDDAPSMAASVGFYSIISLFPLLLAILSIIGWIAGSQSRQDELVEFIIGYLPGSGSFVRNSLAEIHSLRLATTIIGTLGLIWSGSALFGAINKVVNRAWEIGHNPSFLRSKPKQLIMSLGVGGLFVASIALTSFIQWASTIKIGNQTAGEFLGGQGFEIALRIPALFISFLIFAAIYKFLPDTRTRWRFIWIGAVSAAIIFEVAKGLFLWYLEHVAQFEQIYGNVASVVVLMVWAYVCALILIAGAVLSCELEKIKAEQAHTGMTGDRF